MSATTGLEELGVTELGVTLGGMTQQRGHPVSATRQNERLRCRATMRFPLGELRRCSPHR